MKLTEIFKPPSVDEKDWDEAFEIAQTRCLKTCETILENHATIYRLYISKEI